MVNAQEWLDKNYPKKKRNKIKELIIANEDLEGSLDLSDFTKLKELYCYNNQLTFLKLNSCLKLKEILCYNNSLSQDLSTLSHLVNLERLEINNNKFTGSLEPLRSLSKLRRLYIRDTDIDSGLEYLSDSIEYFHCSVYKRKKAKVKVIYDLFANEQGEVEARDGYITSFPQKLKEYKDWIKFGFTQEEINSWLLINDYGFADYFIKQKNYQYSVPNIQETIVKERWQDIHSDFNYQLRKKWEDGRFSKEQTGEWINSGAKADDAGFVSWLRDVKKETPKWVTDYKEDYQVLSDRFKRYWLCEECKQPNTGKKWCKDCNSKRLQQEFTNWTSQNQEIDKFIQKYQLQATGADKFLEWIPYEQFRDIEYLAEGGFGKVYKAKWNEGNIYHWDTKSKQWAREKDKDKNGQNQKNYENEYYDDYYYEHGQNKKYKTHREVVLKSLNNSSTNTDFLQEMEKHKIIDDWFQNIVPCYGLSQDPETGNYLMVMKYIEGGDLRKYLKTKKLTFQDKLLRLVNIAQGLKDLHQKDLVHRDFHSGNILNSEIQSFITDLGLCKPVNKISQEDKIFGVLPYMAPEVLRNKGYTLASDIYSWGMVAYEAISGLPPYHELAHDNFLAIKICQGLRPNLDKIKTPQLLKELIERCWDADPTKRPTATELSRTLNNWVNEVRNNKNTEFTRQFKEKEQFLNSVVPIDYKTHPSAVYTSRLLDFKSLPEPQNSKEINEIFYKLTEGLEDLRIFNPIQFSKELEKKFKLQIKNISSDLIYELESEEITPIEILTNQSQSFPANNYQNVHSDFNEELQKQWETLGFTYTQTKDWINIGLKPADYNLAKFLKTQKNLTPEQTLNHQNLESLKAEFQETEQTPQIIHNPQNN